MVERLIAPLRRSSRAVRAWARGEAGARARLVGRLVLVAFLLVAGARLAGPETFRLSAGTLEVRVRPAIPGGKLSMPLGPFGDLTWSLYNAPLDVDASFVVDRRATALPTAREFEGLAGDFARAKLPWLVAFGVATSLLVYRGARRRHVLAAAITTGAVLVATIGVGVAAVATVNPDALSVPRYRGPVADAPRVLQIIREIGDDFAGVQRNLAGVVAGLQRIHADVVTERAAPPPADAVHVLVISDVHNNPIGLLIAEELIREFDVEVVLNAGDFTDRGTQPEGELFAAFAGFGLPQVVAPGNHEDLGALARVARIPGVVVLDGDAARAEAAGIRVIGASDPNAGSIGDDPTNEVADERIPVICEALRAAIAREPADLLLVHDPRLGECAAADARERDSRLVFVWGHTHQPAFDERGSVIGISPGTSGANGPKSRTEGPYGFALLEFDRDTRRATSVCQFLLDGPNRARQIACHFLHDDPAPAPS